MKTLNRKSDIFTVCKRYIKVTYKCMKTVR